MLLSPKEIRRTLLTYLGNGNRNYADQFSSEAAEAKIVENYGAGSKALSALFHSMCNIAGELRLDESEKSMSGFQDLSFLLLALRRYQRKGAPDYLLFLIDKTP